MALRLQSSTPSFAVKLGTAENNYCILQLKFFERVWENFCPQKFSQLSPSPLPMPLKIFSEADGACYGGLVGGDAALEEIG